MRILTVLTLTAALTLGATAAADAAKLKRGIYDCTAYNYYSGFSTYMNSVKLMKDGKYQHSFGRKDAKLSDPKNGTYKIKRKKIKFPKGPMKHTPGRIDDQKSFELWVDGEPSGVHCYFVANP